MEQKSSIKMSSDFLEGVECVPQRSQFDDRFRGGEHDLPATRPENTPSLHAERNPSVTIIENSVSGEDLPLFLILGRYAIPLGLRKV